MAQIVTLGPHDDLKRALYRAGLEADLYYGHVLFDIRVSVLTTWKDYEPYRYAREPIGGHEVALDAVLDDGRIDHRLFYRAILDDLTAGLPDDAFETNDAIDARRQRLDAMSVDILHTTLHQKVGFAMTTAQDLMWTVSAESAAAWLGMTVDDIAARVSSWDLAGAVIGGGLRVATWQLDPTSPGRLIPYLADLLKAATGMGATLHDLNLTMLTRPTGLPERLGCAPVDWLRRGGDPTPIIEDLREWMRPWPLLD